jgi:hypothetical protein
MHIHSNPMSGQMLALSATQGTQQAAAARRAALAVKKKLASFAATEGDDAVTRAEAHSGSGDRPRKNQNSEEEAFRSVFFSLTV